MKSLPTIYFHHCFNGGNKIIDIDRDDFWEYMEKRKKSYLGRIPSEDFWGEAYQLFLEIASPEELENDILKRDTLQKISKELGFD
jgi:hypothetical protein